MPGYCHPVGYTRNSGQSACTQTLRPLPTSDWQDDRQGKRRRGVVTWPPRSQVRKTTGLQRQQLGWNCTPNREAHRIVTWTVNIYRKKGGSSGERGLNSRTGVALFAFSQKALIFCKPCNSGQDSTLERDQLQLKVHPSFLLDDRNFVKSAPHTAIVFFLIMRFSSLRDTNFPNQKSAPSLGHASLAQDGNSCDRCWLLPLMTSDLFVYHLCYSPLPPKKKINKRKHKHQRYFLFPCFHVWFFCRFKEPRPWINTCMLNFVFTSFLLCSGGLRGGSSLVKKYSEVFLILMSIIFVTIFLCQWVLCFEYFYLGECRFESFLLSMSYVLNLFC